MTKFEDIKFKRVTYTSGENELEGLVFIPQGVGPFPLVTFVHGHNPQSVGAWNSVLVGYFLQQAGFVAFLPSMLGYSLSKGRPDFCGPATVQGIIDGIKIIKEESYVTNDSGIWGISRGATVASQIITVEPDLFKAAVLQAGIYDMKKEYQSAYIIPGIKENMTEETGGSDQAMEERSSILNASNIKASVLLIHGDQDKNVNVEQAKLLDEKLTELGKEHETLILNGADHYSIPKEVRKTHIYPFLKKYLA